MASSSTRYLTWALMGWASFVFLQSLFFKFQGHEETEIIFSTISEWMLGIRWLSWIAPIFESVGGYAIGIAELAAVALIWIPKTRLVGAILGLAVISGAIFFHLATPLGVVRVINAAGDTDGGALFYMACSVWVSCALLFILTKKMATSPSVQSS